MLTARTYLEVTNTLSESIDVYIGDLSKRTFLGTASPGRTRLPVENWRGTYPTFADRNGGAVVGRAVQSTYVCEMA